MQLKYRNLKILIMAYLALPMLIFAAGYLRWYFALPAVLCLAYAFIKACGANSAGRYTKEIRIGICQIAILTIVVLLWTYLGGLNGLFYQSNDWPWRNAIYHDLIDFDWPVIYEEKDSALVYYIGFWLPPALLAKLAGLITGSAIWVWRVARGALWLWSSLGLMLTALAIMVYSDADRCWKQWLVVLIFIFFSGLDIIGTHYSERYEWLTSPEVLHLEWWSRNKKQFSSITTCVYWVFNQSIIPWLATISFLMEKDARNYIFLGMACMCSGPFPFVGLVICMAIKWLSTLANDIRLKQLRTNLRSTFSLSNILLAATIFPVLGVFFTSNISFANTESTDAALTLLERISAYFDRKLVVFLLLEVGIYIVLLWHRHVKDVVFYTVAASLVILPYFHVGFSEDFCMRASIPGVFILMVYCAEYMISELPKFLKNPLYKKAICACLICALLVGAVTPLTEMYRGIYHAVTKKTIQLAQDTIGSIGYLDNADNFTAADYSNSLFFKYMARRP